MLCPVFPITSKQKIWNENLLIAASSLNYCSFSPEISLWVKLLWLKEITPAFKAFLTF